MHSVLLCVAVNSRGRGDHGSDTSRGMENPTSSCDVLSDVHPRIRVLGYTYLWLTKLEAAEPLVVRKGTREFLDRRVRP